MYPCRQLKNVKMWLENITVELYQHLWRSVSKWINITCTKLASTAELMNRVTLYRCSDCDSVCVPEQGCQKQILVCFGKYIFFNSLLFFNFFSHPLVYFNTSQYTAHPEFNFNPHSTLESWNLYQSELFCVRKANKLRKQINKIQALACFITVNNPNSRTT